MTPRSSRSLVQRGDPLRVFVTVPPAEGEANREVVRLVAKALGVAKSRVQIVRGESSRDKTLAVQGLDEHDLAAAVAKIP